ncbi:MAG: gephyrin-like molybdotransferase Glp [Hyphomicrobiaceae bacterium]
MTCKLLDDCFLTDSQRLTHAEALSILRARVAPVVATSRLPLVAANGRILAAAAIARAAVPAHANSAVDGYAFAHGDYDRARGAELAVSARVAAGHALAGPPPAGTAVRIFTGAVVPDGLDTVVMQEDTKTTGAAGAERVAIPAGLKCGANVRKAGEDVAPGNVLLGPGHLIRPQDLAALASIGLAEVACFEPLSVAILSTGDEIVRPGTAALQPGQVYDANAPMLAALVASAGGRAHDLGVVPDKLDVIRRTLAEAAKRHQVILTTGGASRGEEDHMIAALESLGKRHLWQLAIKPGRPMSMGQIGDCIVVGLPGNPVAAFVCFLMYVWPMLRRLGGASWPEPRRLKLPATFDFAGRKPGRREFWRAMLVEGPGGLAVDKFKRDGSGLISGLSAADGLIDIPEAHGDVRQGDLVDFIPFSEFGILGS